MKKLVFFTIIPFMCWAQSQSIPINANYSSFYLSDTTAYVEVYISINQSVLNYEQIIDGNYEASFTNKISISKDGEPVSQFSHPYKNTTEDPTQFNSMSQFIDIFKMELPYGKYVATILTVDNNSNSRSELAVELKTIQPKNDVFFSDIELCTSIKRNNSESIFYKNGLHVIPNPSSKFNIQNPFLYFYVEINNLPYSDNKQYSYKFHYSVTNSKGETIKSEKPKIKNIVAPNLVEVGGVNVGSLPEDKYILYVSVEDQIKKINAIQKKSFNISNTTSNEEFVNISKSSFNKLINSKKELEALEKKYYNTKNPTDLMKWEEAIMNSIQSNPAVEFKKRQSFPIPPIVRGEHQLRFTISPTENKIIYKLELEATDDQASINKISLLGNGSIIRIKGTVPFPFEIDGATDESITGAVTRSESPGISNSSLRILLPIIESITYVIDGDKDDPLTFLAITGTGKNDGIIYMHGKGSVKKQDGSIININLDHDR